MDLFLDKEFRQLIPPLELEELSELEDSIKKYGNLVPIIIWKEKKLVLDGHNRYDLCIKHGKELKLPIEMSFPDRESAMLWLIDNQLARRNLSEFSKVQLRLTKQDIQLKIEAKERQATSGPGIYGGKPLRQTFAEPVLDDRKVDALIGKAAGVSRETVRKVRHIRKKATPEQKAKLVKGEATINQVYVQIHRQEVKEEVKHTQWPTGKYRVLYADPPWSYSNTQPDYHTVQDDHYPTMSLNDICALPVKELSLDNAVLFLWATSPILEDSFKVINAWGFKYKASFVWDKVNHNMGHYNSVRHEFLLIAVRGSCQPDNPKLFDSVQAIERTSSGTKPELFREIINTLYPHGPRIELFARGITEGWECYGNQVAATVPE